MYDKLECCRLILDAVKIALQEAVFWLSPNEVRCLFFSTTTFLFFYLLFHDMLLRVMCPLFQHSLFASICLLFCSLVFCSLLWVSLSLSCALALTPEPFTWASSPVPEQIGFDTAASQLQFNLRSLLCRWPQEATLKHVDERSEVF